MMDGKVDIFTVILLVLASRTLVHLLLEAHYRHRVPMEPYLIMLAAYGVTHAFLFPTALKAMMKAEPRPRRHGLKLRALMSARRIAENLLATNGGERRLTDILHISELLQEAANQLEISQR